ncbi:hypothetical protein KC19_VG114600 [Ceratodon purpureus]|uniref:Uncharacterized protein n=1 Tax=Ceratodon purpureus TaxID=3225 RepID=A0A8T0HP07_CERPU|nr:hypothetical protein KC19_VG114600 [Ceratodon purpureus]
MVRWHTTTRLMGRRKAFGLAFACGVLAVKRGFLINWAVFASRQCRKGKTARAQFIPLERPVQGVYLGRGVADDSDENSECSNEDWVLNPQVPPYGLYTAREHYNLRHLFRVYPPQAINRPLYISIKYPTDKQSQIPSSTGTYVEEDEDCNFYYTAQGTVPHSTDASKNAEIQSAPTEATADLRRPSLVDITPGGCRGRQDRNIEGMELRMIYCSEQHTCSRQPGCSARQEGKEFGIR